MTIKSGLRDGAGGAAHGFGVVASDGAGRCAGARVGYGAGEGVGFSVGAGLTTDRWWLPKASETVCPAVTVTACGPTGTGAVWIQPA